MAEHLFATGEPLSEALEAQIDGAMADARERKPDVRALRVEYLRDARLLLFHLNDGSRFPLPVEDVQDIAHASDEQIANFELEAEGRMIHFPDFDGNMHIPTLVAGIRGGKKWMDRLAAKREATMASAA